MNSGGLAGAVWYRELEAGVAEGIVTGGDIHAADRFLVADTEGDDRRRCVAVGQQRFQPGLLQNFRRGQGEFPSQKPCVVTDNNQRAFAMCGERLRRNSALSERARPCAAKRRFSKVKSRAISPRQPEVPNWMGEFKSAKREVECAWPSAKA